MKAGYRPKTVRLHYIADDPALIARCHRLQADMLSWASGGNGAPHYDGTVASLVRLYETHENSSYRDIEQSTQRAYSKALALWIVKHTGNRLVEAVTGNDVRQWFKKLVASGLSVNTAYFAINVFKVALAFGSSLRLAGCRELREELRDTRFFGGQRRTEQLTYEQMTTLRDKARAMGLHYLARCIVLQFEFAMRRRDVIGKWYTDGAGTDGIRHGKRVWRDGLTWADKDDDGVIRRVVSKTRRTTASVAVRHRRLPQRRRRTGAHAGRSPDRPAGDPRQDRPAAHRGTMPLRLPPRRASLWHPSCGQDDGRPRWRQHRGVCGGRDPGRSDGACHPQRGQDQRTLFAGACRPVASGGG